MTIQQGHLQLDQRENGMGRAQPSIIFFLSSRLLWCATSGGRFNGDGERRHRWFTTDPNGWGYTIVQDKETCTVFGMPRYAIEQGVVDEVLPLQDIEAKLHRWSGEEDGRRICLI